jgi:hypothetical protein
VAVAGSWYTAPSHVTAEAAAPPALLVRDRTPARIRRAALGEAGLVWRRTSPVSPAKVAEGPLGGTSGPGAQA